MYHVTSIQLFNAMSNFLEKYYYETNSDDIGSLLSSMQFLHDEEPIDSALWNDWIRILGNKKLVSSEEGFIAMKVFLQNFYQYQPSNEIISLLQSLDIKNNKEVGLEVWNSWTESLEKSKNSKPYITLINDKN